MQATARKTTKKSQQASDFIVKNAQIRNKPDDNGTIFIGDNSNPIETAKDLFEGRRIAKTSLLKDNATPGLVMCSYKSVVFLGDN